MLFSQHCSIAMYVARAATARRANRPRQLGVHWGKCTNSRGASMCVEARPPRRIPSAGLNMKLLCSLRLHNELFPISFCSRDGGVNLVWTQWIALTSFYPPWFQLLYMCKCRLFWAITLVFSFKKIEQFFWEVTHQIQHQHIHTCLLIW